jgi:hypothetical protein
VLSRLALGEPRVVLLGRTSGRMNNKMSSNFSLSSKPDKDD